MNTPPKHIVKHLFGGTVGCAYISAPYSTSIEILTGSSTDEGGYTPAESASIVNIEGIKNLRALCDEAVKAYEEANPQPK